MNPALIDAPYVSFPFMGNINVGATGNMGYKNFIYKLEGNPLYNQTTFMSPTVSASDSSAVCTIKTVPTSMSTTTSSPWASVASRE